MSRCIEFCLHISFANLILANPPQIVLKQSYFASMLSDQAFSSFLNASLLVIFAIKPLNLFQT